MKMTWKTINTVRNRKKNNGKLPDKFSHKNSSTTVTDPVNIANEFNKYFVETGPQLAKKILNDDISYRNYLVTENELLTEIINLKETKVQVMMK